VSGLITCFFKYNLKPYDSVTFFDTKLYVAKMTKQCAGEVLNL